MFKFLLLASLEIKMIINKFKISECLYSYYSREILKDVNHLGER